jgi:hypothetical protein
VLKDINFSWHYIEIFVSISASIFSFL